MPSHPKTCATLLEQVPADGSTIGNLKLREQLGWDEERYDFAEFVSLQKTFADSPKSWSAAVKTSTRRPSTSP